MTRLYTLLALILLSGCAVNKTSTTIHPFTGGQLGCGNFTIYKLSEDNKEFVSVSFQARGIDFQESQEYSLDQPKIVVKRKKYADAIDASLCNDVMSEMPELLSESVATKGSVEIKILSEDIEKSKTNDAYRVTLVLKNIVFSGSEIDYLQIENVVVGWMPG